MTDRPSATRRWLTLYLLVRALAVTFLGILLLIRPDDTVRTLARVTGAVLLMVGQSMSSRPCSEWPCHRCASCCSCAAR